VGAISGGSKVARALIKALMNSKVLITIKFNNDLNFKSDPGDYSMHNITLYSKTDSELLSSTFVHELTHALTDVNGFDAAITDVFFNDKDKQAIKRKYQEATAITVEQQFRKDMGYEERDTQKYGGIGVNGYAQFTNEYTNAAEKDLEGVDTMNFNRGQGIVAYLISISR